MRTQVETHIRRTQRNEGAVGKGGQAFEHGHVHINRHCDKVSIKFVEREERKQIGGYEYRTKHKTRSARNTGRKIV